nr:uncharacterized protein LOC101261775 [Solanum lycopersicum]
MIPYLGNTYITPLDIQVRDQHVYYNVVEAEPDGELWYSNIKNFLKTGRCPEHAIGSQKRTVRCLTKTLIFYPFYLLPLQLSLLSLHATTLPPSLCDRVKTSLPRGVALLSLPRLSLLDFSPHFANNRCSVQQLQQQKQQQRTTITHSSSRGVLGSKLQLAATRISKRAIVLNSTVIQASLTTSKIQGELMLLAWTGSSSSSLDALNFRHGLASYVFLAFRILIV